MNIHGRYRIEKILKPSNSPAFKKAEVGDVIYFSAELTPSGRSHEHGIIAKRINCLNTRTWEESNLTFNQIGRTLNQFEWKELQDYE